MALKVKVKEIENSAERLICTGLIVSDKVASQLSGILEPQAFTAKYTQFVAEWCLDYYQHHKKAPGAHIQHIFESQKRNYLEEDVSSLIEALLADLSDHFEGEAQFNSDYVLEEAEKYIKSRSALILAEDVLALLSQGRIMEAEGKIAAYNIPKRPVAEGEDVFDSAFWVDEEETDSAILFKLSGALGQLIGPVERDSFISIIAPEKRGKTWWLLFLALTAFRQRCNVVFFSIGDMTMNQVKRRIRHMLTGVDPKRPRATVNLPIPDCWHNQCGDCPLDFATDSIMKGGRGKSREVGDFEDFPDHKPCTRCLKDKKDFRYFSGAPWYKEVKIEDEYVPLDKAMKMALSRSGHKRFRLFCFPPDSVTVSDINAQLDILQQQEDFIPDVVVVDYADLLLADPSTRRQDVRHQINTDWKQLRKLSQVRNCAVITATQAKSDARKRSQVEQWDTSEDKRKIGHVTAMLALNQTPEEKRQQIMRISNLAMRDDDFDTDLNVEVLQCLALGRPYLTSYFHKPRPKAKKKEADDE